MERASWWRARVVELSVLAVLATSVPGLLWIGLAPPRPYAFLDPRTGVHVSASTAHTHDNFDPAFVLDGQKSDPRLAWVSQRDPAPWLHIELPSPRQVARVVVTGAPAGVKHRPPERASVVCEGSSESRSRLEATGTARELAARIDAACTAVRVHFEDPWLSSMGVGVLEVELEERAP